MAQFTEGELFPFTVHTLTPANFPRIAFSNRAGLLPKLGFQGLVSFSLRLSMNDNGISSQLDITMSI